MIKDKIKKFKPIFVNFIEFMFHYHRNKGLVEFEEECAF